MGTFLSTPKKYKKVELKISKYDKNFIIHLFSLFYFLNNGKNKKNMKIENRFFLIAFVTS